MAQADPLDISGHEQIDYNFYYNVTSQYHDVLAVVSMKPNPRLLMTAALLLSPATGLAKEMSDTRNRGRIIWIFGLCS